MMIRNREELKRVANECKSMVTKRAAASGAVAIIPLPGTDIVADIGMMLELFPAINRKFGLTPDQIEMLDPATKVILSRMILRVGNDLAGKIITKELLLFSIKKAGKAITARQITKFIPIFGQIVSATIAFATMKYMGNSHIDDCVTIISRVIDHNN